ncbi:Endonuclease/exonuclease/phosphatase [Aspergillus nidulans var. acristatus]
MEAITAQAIRDTAAFRKPSAPWTLDEPYPQSYYSFDPTISAWVSKSPSTAAEQSSPHAGAVAAIALYTWNIDFMLPFAAARMRPALAHLNELIRDLHQNVAPVIFLQECTPSDLGTIAAAPWVQDHFHVTDIDPTNWATTQYGTITLISKRVPVASVFRVHYSRTRMNRDALFVDITVGHEKRIRLCNTHLESLALEPPYRPLQMQLIAKYMHKDDIYAAVAAGDFNAIQPFDRTLHADNNLKDAFLESGGKEDTPEGYTWGQQAATSQRAQFGCSRMDKVYFCGSVKVLKFEKFGEGVLVEGDEERRQIVNLGFEEPWITDHLGVMAVFDVGLSMDSQL